MVREPGSRGNREAARQLKMTVIGPAEGLNLDAFKASVNKAVNAQVRRQVRRPVQGHAPRSTVDDGRLRAPGPRCAWRACRLRVARHGAAGRRHHADHDARSSRVASSTSACPGPMKLARYSGLGVIFLTVPLLLARDGHVKVDMFFNLLPERAAPRRAASQRVARPARSARCSWSPATGSCSARAASRRRRWAYRTSCTTCPPSVGMVLTVPGRMLAPRGRRRCCGKPMTHDRRRRAAPC